MSKNIKLNDTNYNGVSTVQLPTTDGGNASFKDVDEITTPSGSKTITENGTHDVTNFAQAIVNVATSGSGSVSGAKKGVVNPSENTFELTIETGLDEIKGFLITLTDTTAQSVRTLNQVFIDVENDIKLTIGSNSSGSTHYGSGKLFAVNDINDNTVTVNISGGNISMTAGNASGNGYFVTSTYRWYAW